MALTGVLQLVLVEQGCLVEVALPQLGVAPRLLALEVAPRLVLQVAPQLLALGVLPPGLALEVAPRGWPFVRAFPLLVRQLD